MKKTRSIQLNQMFGALKFTVGTVGICAFLALFSTQVAAAGGAVALDHIRPDVSDQASLQRGAQTFTNYCMGCHSAKYARYIRVADDLGISEKLYTDNLILNGSKIGELMDIAMAPEQAKNWFGAPPPDLTLEARLRGPDWVYSYLRGFYKDTARPMGVNNVVFPNVGMPHVLAELQGLCAEPPHMGGKAKIDPLSGALVHVGGCASWVSEGVLNKGEYDQLAYDLTNFLVYMAEPMQAERKRLGILVLIFIGIFFVFTYLLNREFWKDVH